MQTNFLKALPGCQNFYKDNKLGPSCAKLREDGEWKENISIVKTPTKPQQNLYSPLT